MAEINLYGIYIPILLVQAIIAYILFRLVRPVTDRLAERGWIAVPGIFNLCFYLGILLLVHGLFVWLWA